MMDKTIARAREKRKGKKTSITVRCKNIAKLIDQRGSRTRVKHAKDELQKVLNDAVLAHELYLQLLTPEHKDFNDDWIENLAIEVDGCCALVEDYLETRAGEPPSVEGSVASARSRQNSFSSENEARVQGRHERRDEYAKSDVRRGGDVDDHRRTMDLTQWQQGGSLFSTTGADQRVRFARDEVRNEYSSPFDFGLELSSKGGHNVSQNKVLGKKSEHVAISDQLIEASSETEDNQLTDLLFKKLPATCDSNTGLDLNSVLQSYQPTAKKAHEAKAPTIDNSGLLKAAEFSMRRMDLERLPLPKFNGDKYEYEEWKDTFMTCVGNSHETYQWKMLRLKSCLEGEAKSMIKGLDNSKTAYEMAMDRLELEYGGTRRVLSRHLHDLREAPQINAGNPKDLRKFVSLLDAVMLSLRNHGRDDALNDGMLHHIAKSKIPKSFLCHFKRWMKGQKKTDDIANLRDWLMEEAVILVEAQEDTEGFKKITKKESCGTTIQGEKICILCDGKHEIDECNELTRMTPAERFEKVRLLK